MKEFIDGLNEFLKSPLGVAFYALLLAIGGYAALYVKTRGEIKAKAATTKAEIEAVTSKAIEETQTEAKKLAQEREKENLERDASFRRIMDNTQKRLDKVESDKDKLDQELDAAKSAVSAAQTALKLREEESHTNADNIVKLNEQLDKQSTQLDNMKQTVERSEDEKIAALKLVEARDHQLAQRDQELKERDEKIAILERRQGENDIEITVLKERVAELEKRKTGPLPPPADVPPSDPAVAPSAALNGIENRVTIQPSDKNEGT